MRRSVLVRGLALEVYPPGDWVSDTIRATGDFYEAAILDELCRRLGPQPPGVLVDAGAMIGNHSVYLAAFVPHTAVHAFEPYAPSREVLERNVARWPEVIVHREALSDQARQDVSMAVEPTNRGHAVIVATDPWPQDNLEPFTADTVTLDSLELEDVRLLKVDVEWHEPAVLAGARATITRCRPLIVLEDWRHEYGALLPDYRLAAEWELAHQTFLYAPV